LSKTGDGSITYGREIARDRPEASFAIQKNRWYFCWYSACFAKPIPTMALTDAKIRSAKAGDKVKKLSDGRGLQLCVMPTGGRLWRLAYRFDGKQRTLSLGEYGVKGVKPDVGLAAAREKAAEARALLMAGVDPSQNKRDTNTANTNSRARTFRLIADELIAKKKREGKAERTLDKLQWLYGLAAPFIGELPISHITSPQVLAALQSVETKGLHETARKMRAVVGQVFRYAIATGRAANDPTSALRGALTSPIVTPRAAITSPKEFGALLRAIDGFEGQPETKACLRLMALLFPRPGELRLAEWSEFDLTKAVWTIPAKRMKMRREHICPLARQAIEILEALRETSSGGPLVFPGVRSVRRPISENTMNATLRRLGFAQAEMTSHGFRASASTLLNESGKFSADAIEAALAHQDKDAVRRAYARGTYWDERLKLAQWWADHLDTLRRGAEVVQLPVRTRL
jgi:integrase